MKTLLILFASIFFHTITAQGQTSAKAAGMGNLSAAQAGGFSLFHNPAGLALIKDLTFLANTEQSYLLSGINMSNVGTAVPTGSGVFGLTVFNFGFSEFRQHKLGVAYARQLLKQIYFGAQLNYFQTRIPEYGSAGKVSFEIGIQGKLTKELLIGAFISNPYQTGGVDGSILPAVFQMGISYLVSDKLITGLELEKDIDFPLRIKYGLEYKIMEKICIRTGFGSNPTNFHFGVGFQVNDKLSFDIGNKYDPSLGLTPSLSAGYVVKK